MSEHATLAVAPSPELLLFAERAAQFEECQPALTEKRSEARPPLFVSVTVQPLDRQLTPLGPPRAALTRNISRHGLSILIEDWPEPDSLAVQLVIEGKACCLLVKEKWRNEDPPFTVIGLRTVKQLQAHTFEKFVDGSFRSPRVVAPE